MIKLLLIMAIALSIAITELTLESSKISYERGYEEGLLEAIKNKDKYSIDEEERVVTHKSHREVKV